MTYDAIIVGAGGMGSAAAFHLARRGSRVLVLERHTANHALGSSHGLTRIIRLAYFEHPSYVPLLRRSFDLWRELEGPLDGPVLHITGALDVGPIGSGVFDGSLQSCEAHGLPHDVLDADALRRRFPGWSPAPNACAVYQPDGGFLEPERCIAAHLAGASAAGAVLRENEAVLEWSAGSEGVRVTTNRATYVAAQLVLAAGAWNGKLLPDMNSLMVPERQVVGWFDVAQPTLFAPSAFPVFVLDADEGRYYGFPEHGTPGFKIGKYHHRFETVDPDTIDRACHSQDERELRMAVARYFPGANGEMSASGVCMFTNTPDEHFIIDRVLGAPEVLLLSPCSGHGFKFCSVVGEICADLVTRDATRHDISRFRLDRFPGPT